MNETPNLLLRRASPQLFKALRAILSDVRYGRGTVLAEMGVPVERVFFPYSGAVSLLIEMSGGATIETAAIGRDGAVNAAAALDHKHAMSKAIVIIPATGAAARVDLLKGLAEKSPELRQLLVRHLQVLFGEVQQAGACNAIDVIEARLCRWLLRIRDLVESDELPITQDMVAQMLGVRRPSVSLVAATLQKAGLIRYRRGHIELIDIEGLKNSSCECYETVRQHYGQLLGVEKP